MIHAPSIEGAAYSRLTPTMTALTSATKNGSLLPVYFQQSIISGFRSGRSLRPNGGHFDIQMASTLNFTRQSYLSEAGMFGFNAEV